MSMRAYSWIALGTVAFACGGSAFTSDAPGGADGGADTGSAGVLGRAGRGSGGSLLGNGGKPGNGGTGSGISGGVSVGGLVSVGGQLGIAGDLVTGGSPPVAGMTSTAGTGGTGPGPDKTCPRTQPEQGDACADGLVCSYGADVRTACRPLAKCDDGAWQIEKPMCEALHGCPALQVGKACNQDAPCLLNEAEGIYCVCTGCGSGGPCTIETVWACAAGSGGSACPKLPPNQGQACTGEVKCGYGSCSTDNGMQANCDGATWNWEFLACPL